MNDEEQYIHECLRRLQEQYYKNAKPYMERLAQLKSLETPTLFMPLTDEPQLLRKGDWLDTTRPKYHGITGESK